MPNLELLPALVPACLTWGAITGLSQHLRPLLHHRLGSQHRGVDLLPGIFVLGLLLGLPISGLAVDEWGPAWGMVLAPVGMALVFAALAFEPRLPQPASASVQPRGHYALHLLAMLSLGLATAWQGVAATMLMPTGFAPERPALALALGFFFVAGGRALVPLLTKPLRDPGQSGQALTTLACLSLVPGFVALVTPFAWPVGHAVNLEEAFSSSVVNLAVVALAFLGLLTQRLQSWASEQATQRPWGARAYRWAFLAGRLAIVPLLVSAGMTYEYDPWALFWFGVVLIVMLGQIMGDPESKRLPWSLAGAGLALGPMLPLALALAWLPTLRDTGFVLGLLLSGWVIGEETLSPVINWALQRAPGKPAERVPLATGLVVVVAWLTLAMMQIKEDRRVPRPPLPFRVPHFHLPQLPHFRFLPYPAPRPTPTTPPPASAPAPTAAGEATDTH